MISVVMDKSGRACFIREQRSREVSFLYGLRISLLVGVGLMVVLTVYPPLLTTASGQADHTLASVLLFAMCAGLVKGVGFVPRWWGWRLPGWADATVTETRLTGPG